MILDNSTRYQQWYAQRICQEKVRDTALYHDIKTNIFKKIVSPVLEIGFGAASNFAYLPKNTCWYGIDSNQAFNNFIQTDAKKYAVKIVKVSNQRAEKLPFPSGFFMSVVTTHVLCSVSDPSKVLQEIKRVLRPNGTYYFLEHIRSDDLLESVMQDVLTPLTRCVSGNCHLNRKTEQFIRASGFTHIQLQSIRIGPKHIASQIAGIAKIC